MGRRVKRTRNAETWTESEYWGHIRSALRNGLKYWKPALKAKMMAKRKYKGKNKRQKWEYKCAKCGGWFKDKEVQIDHINPVGSLRCGADVEGFLERLTPEQGFQILCKTCHSEKTAIDRENIKRGRKE